jgi:hypothetical protein
LIGPLLLAAALSGAAQEAPARHVTHALTVALDAAGRRLAVTDTLTLPPGQAAEFLLNASLGIVSSEPAVEEIPVGDVSFFGINAGAAIPKNVTLKRYRAKTPPAGGRLRVSYAGAFDFGLSDQKEEYTRGFRETAGIVSPEGVYLSGSGFWYPYFGPALVEFSVEVEQPAGWHVISQGNGTSRDAAGRARWESHGAMDEIYLVGGPLVRYSEQAGVVEALAYLRAKDDALAARYLQATAQYVEMYRGLIGPYPYGKFALVENFWETGYGMPSFTLLGPQIIRFPFILTSSYPHEILHNWWGNSVFVDYETGNWCEGLTSYLADHLIQEQRGRGHEWRQATLQKYRDYVKAGRDFPLSEFRGRHSAATEAVGYGKTAIGVHMLRRVLGDDAFRKLLGRFYREFKGRRASFGDVQKTAEAVAGASLPPPVSLGRFFDDWVRRPGAAALTLENLRVVRESDAYVTSGELVQAQAEEPFLLPMVPLVLQTAGEISRTETLSATRRTPFRIRTAAEPLVLSVDPWFDVFRKLDPRETPPAIGMIFGEPRILALLPSQAPPAEQQAYRDLLRGWQSDAHAIEVRLDSEITELPADRSLWLLGRRNRFAPALFPDSPAFRLSETEMRVDGEAMPLAGHSAVLVARHPRNVEKAAGWIFADPRAAFPGLGRKLPHYGKYSYLGFEGDEPVNVIKGQWAASDSPLRVDLRAAAARSGRLEPLAVETRKALAELPPVFSQQKLMEHVAYLASPDLQGRGLGSAGEQGAAKYIAGQFEAMGLKPAGDGGTFFQRFRVEKGPAGTPVEVANVVAVLPGTKSEWKHQSVVVSAHYDHLGLGWPDVHKGDEGKVHPGADDNASGVAVMLELARALASGERPQRSIVFAAFTGEESGLLGSKHYVEHPGTYPLSGVIGVVNIDTVGRLGSEKLSVLGTGTASEWQHIFRGAGFVTGVDSRNIPESMQSSDQMSFIGKGVPGVQLFTSAHADYHRPGDTADKIDGPGLVKVATFVKEAIVYLGERPEPLTNTIPKAAAGATAAPPASGTSAPPQGRRVSFGTVPDFAFPGPGVRVSGVVPGSPAEKAGLKEGDVVLRIDDQAVANLAGFSGILRTLSAGQAIRVAYSRDGQEQTVTVTVAER